MKQKGIWIDADNIAKAATLKEHNRIIAKMRQDAVEARANGFNSQAMAWNDYANKLEAES